MIGVIDYGMGNLRSVEKALQHLGGSVKFVQSESDLDLMSGLLLPGVGAFGDAVKNLKQTGLWNPILQWIEEDRPFFGICLGYQLLFEESEEAPGAKGLSVFKGNVIRFPSPDKNGGLKVPHMGWNEGKIKNKTRFLQEVAEESFYYFVHSYYPKVKESSLMALETTYGVSFASAISRGNLFATQFHPEKSQKSGLQLLKNFIQLSESAVSVSP